jgi:hypothetical protein
MNAAKKLWFRIGVTLSEPSTWRGIIRVAMALGIFSLSADQQEAIVVAGLALSGLLGVFFKDESNPAPILRDKRDDVLDNATSINDVLDQSRDENETESGV